jgi:hypothetical protein
MSRLFITSREIDLISDLTKEVIKDVAGQKIFFYKVRHDLTDIHDVYEEAEDKVFDPPVEIEARVEWQPQEVTTGRYASESLSTITIFLHERDLLDRDIDPEEGDFFSYGTVFFEITSAIIESTVYGQIEHSVGLQLVGKQARMGLIDRLPIGPTDESYTDADAVQDTFVQQRGFEENRLGPTADQRSLQKRGILEKPITGPAEVSSKGGGGSENEVGTIESSFYSDS